MPAPQEFVEEAENALGERRLLRENDMRAMSPARMRGGAAAILLLAMFPAALPAQQPTGSGTHAAAQPAPQAPAQEPAVGAHAPAPKGTLADLAWLEGRWRGDWGTRVAEQVWFAPRAGVMTGLFRLVESDKTLVIELFTLVEKPSGVDFYLRHFTPALVPWEKSDATVLNLATLDAAKVDFENPVNGQPKHAIFVRVDPDTYTARSEIVPETGEPQVVEITYRRQKPAAEKPAPTKKR